ncbi:hypothetical protein [Mycoplasma suis]|uniref:Uncharacterized protein n=2 Tax=Mycoplasma suis TaxID=57372 RepID=F0QS10_MYCSL|nr:hypothetical protein [Mycoplasma suis]ADX98280.1 hypothetical protein MSU_0755 [Mycoplasma suis str. Illinois]CBZ40795.1 hypothetical protein MSUIS_07020 [Mycoplasma suis KI3806]
MVLGFKNLSTLTKSLCSLFFIGVSGGGTGLGVSTAFTESSSNNTTNNVLKVGGENNGGSLESHDSKNPDIVNASSSTEVNSNSELASQNPITTNNSVELVKTQDQEDFKSDISTTIQVSPTRSSESNKGSQETESTQEQQIPKKEPFVSSYQTGELRCLPAVQIENTWSQICHRIHHN